MVVAEAGPDGATRYRLLETLRQYGEQALAPDATATMRDRHLAHFLARAEHWYAQQCTADGTAGQPGVRRQLGQPPGRVRLGAGDGPRAATWPTCCTPPTGSPRTPAGGNTAIGPPRPAPPVSTQAESPAPPSSGGASPAQSDAPTETFAALDPTAPDLLARDVERIWLARAGTAFLTNSPDEIERAAAWLQEREPRCDNPITEAWILANIMSATLSAPDPALVARVHRLGQASPSPSVQAIAGFVLHGVSLPEPQAG